MRRTLGCALLLSVLTSSTSCESESANRFGASEEFRDVEAWHPDKPVEGLRFTSDGEFALIETPMRGDPNTELEHRWDTPSTSTVVRSMGRIDLDQYPFLVVSNPRRSVLVWMAVNRIPLPVAYTTGVTAVDMRPYGLRGEREVELLIRAYNTGGSATFDFIRFASRLDASERARLTPPGSRVHLETLEAHPYHELETLLARQGGFLTPPRHETSNQVAFRDTGTHAELRQLTGGAGADGVPRPGAISPDGSTLIFPGGTRGRLMWLLDLETGEIRPTPFTPADPVRFADYGRELLFVRLQASRENREVFRLFYGSWNPQTGDSNVLLKGEIPRAVREGMKVTFDRARKRVAISSRRSPLGLLLEPRAANPRERWSALVLPYPVHNLSFGADPDHVWGYIEGSGTRMLLRLSEAAHGHTAAGRPELRWGPGDWTLLPNAGDGHGANGPDGQITNFRPVKLFARVPEIVDDRPGDKIRIAFNWLPPAPKTNYGQFAPDPRWVGADGSAGLVADQFVLMSLVEPATMMQIAFHNTSSIDWGSKPYLRFSPDSTKLFYGSDMLGKGRLFYARLRRPDAPRQLRLQRTDRNRVLDWERAPGLREIAGYNVYAEGAPRLLTRVNPQLIAGPPYEIPAGVEADRFRVTHVEPSGLESFFSDAAGTGPGLRISREAELGRLLPPFREHFDGRLSGYRGALLSPAREDEDGRAGTIRFLVDITVGGPWRALARVRGGPLELKGIDGDLARLHGDSAHWSWISTAPFELRAGEQEIRVEASEAGSGLDVLVLIQGSTGDPSEPPPGGVLLDEGLFWSRPDRSPLSVSAQPLSPFAARVAWSSPVPRGNSNGHDHYRVYAARGPESPRPENRSALAWTRDETVDDAGLEPDTHYRYLVQAMDSRERVVAEGRTGLTTPAHDAVLQRLEVEDVSRDPSLHISQENGVAFVSSRPGEDGRIDFELTAPRAGDYLLWVRHRVQGGPLPRRLRLSIDRDGHVAELHRFIIPGQPVRILQSKPESRLGIRWNEDPILLDGRTNLLPLVAGVNQLSLTWRGGGAPSRGEPPWLELDRMTLTDDPSWRPVDWDPRIDFVPEQSRGENP